MTNPMGLESHVRVVRPEGFVLDVELDIPAGHTVALLGPNGSGKSTVVNALAGLVPLDDGFVRLNGRSLEGPDVRVPAEQRGMGIVFQDYLLFPHLTALENVAFSLRSRGESSDAAARVAQDHLEDLGVGDLADRRPADLSGGQAQSVALARALASQPEMLLLDEPFAALDVTTRGRLRGMVADHLADFEGPRLLITHEPTEAFLLADTVHVLEGGVVTQVGSADEIRLRPKTSYIADLAGLNLLRGNASRGVVDVAGHPVHTANEHIEGPAIVVIHPRAIALYMTRPQGSPRNTWQTAITRIEHLGERVRIQTEDPVSLTAEITLGASEALHLEPGVRVWLAVKATEIDVQVAD